ncbi:MAG: hypothetical protein E7194_11580 [Erysipelotrichaceae bacterium]|nr:hypothetical protein [Erysipelotrichaceae bacterium]
MEKPQIMDKKETRRYILNPFYAFRGWKMLPYAIMHLRKPGTMFMNREEWLCACTCDGQHDIDWNGLSEKQRHIYEVLEQRGYIHECHGNEQLDSKGGFFHCLF